MHLLQLHYMRLCCRRQPMSVLFSLTYFVTHYSAPHAVVCRYFIRSIAILARFFGAKSNQRPALINK